MQKLAVRQDPYKHCTKKKKKPTTKNLKNLSGTTPLPRGGSSVDAIMQLLQISADRCFASSLRVNDSSLSTHTHTTPPHPPLNRKATKSCNPDVQISSAHFE